jgi:hypothetical protein
LYVGLLSPGAANSGLVAGDTLDFQVLLQGKTVVDESFTQNFDATAYFTDNVLDLGPENAGLNGGNLNLQFDFSLTSASVANGFSEQLVFGTATTVPEPGMPGLLLVTATGCLTRRRRKPNAE